jgi:RNA polymerase sigma factor (TIGR02999 family)
MMAAPSPKEVTQLLLAWKGGDDAALERLIPIVYEELRQTARRYMRRERPGHTLQTTALVNEVYLRLVDADRIGWQNRAHFLAVSAQLMRRVLVDFARRRQQLKRGGRFEQVTLDEPLIIAPGRDVDLLALDEALEALAKISHRQAQVIELRYFAGLSEDETAEALGVAVRTVRRDWSLARAWLYRQLAADAG